MKNTLLLALMQTQMIIGQETEVPVIPSHPLEKQISAAERDFRNAEKMFDPYYTGPLLAPGVTIPAPGHAAVQPYLFVTHTYGAYDDRGRSFSVPKTNTVSGALLGFIGITRWLGVQLAVGYIGNWREGQSANNWDDSSITLLFPILKETPYRPGMLIGVRESFPTGNYQNLNPNKGGIDATGTGAYQTSFFFNIAKMFWLPVTHPMRLRLSTQYKLPYHVRVHNYNAFGGGAGANAKVRLPFAFSADLGYEFSFTQKIVAALDILYTLNQKTTFTGFSGFTACCDLANIGGPRNQNLSLAPALEYNIDDHSGLIAGPWFSVWGRNSSQFIAGVFSYYYSW